MMNKFKLFLILILSTVLCIPKADAIVNIDGSIFTQAPQLNFYDNTRGTLTSVGSGYNDTFGYWVSNNSLITTGANTDGVNVTFTANEGFVSGYTYSLSILIGTESSRAKPSSTRICTAENITNANIRFQQGYPCTNAISITSMDGLANFDFGDVSTPMTILTYVFIPDFTSPTITLTYNTVGGNNSRHLFGGYSLTVLSDNKNGISSSEVQSIINNSGLASADSVQELQTEINNVKQDINDASNAIVDSNKETQDVIKDQTKEQIESQKVCEIIDNNKIIQDGALENSGNSTFVTDRGITNYIKINKNDTLKRIKKNTTSNSNFLCFYNINKEKINCYSQDIYNNNEILYIPENSSYVRFTIIKTLNEPQFELCKNGNQALNDNINDLNDNITSSDTSSSEGQAGSFFEGFETDDYGLSDIVTMPLQLINTLTNNTCVSLKLTLPFVNHQFELPCMSSIYQRHFGTFFTLYQTITFGFTSYWVIVRIFNLVKDFKNPDHDEIEVLDL